MEMRDETSNVMRCWGGGSESDEEDSRRTLPKWRLTSFWRLETGLGLSQGRLKRGNDGASSRSDRKRFIIDPNSWWFGAWTQFILVWAVYSSFFTPMEFGFYRGLPPNLFFLDIAGQLAFLFDIALRFFVSFRDPHSHSFVFDRRLIALRYLKSRFVIDFLGCCPWDAIYKACGRNEVVRYMLWIRLSRALRVTEFFEKLEKDIRINYLFTRIVKLFVVELYCTHTAACIFYYLATTLPPSKEGYTWIGSLKMGDFSYSHFRDIDIWKRYVTSLYFAIVTMATLGYGDIHAVNVREMIFIMLYVSFDMILGAYLLGNMTALIVKGSKTEKFRDKMSNIMKYINRNKLGRNISNEIKCHVRVQYESSHPEAAILQDLPSSIRSKISQKLYEPYIKEISLFKGCSLEFIRQIATRVHEEVFLPGEVIIEQGTLVDQLYFIHHNEVVEVGRDFVEIGKSILFPGTYSSYGEISVFCNMPAPYSIQVRELCRLLRLDKQSFLHILDMYLSDGKIVLDNFLEGRDENLRYKLLESDITLHICKHELDLAVRLNCAVYDGDIYRVKCLIRARADPSRRDYDGRSPLHVASSKGYGDIVIFLLQQKVPVDIVDNFGNTPLLEAIKNGHDHVASLLVNAGALSYLDDSGDCLCKAVARKDFAFLKRILANGIDPNAKNYDSRTPLHIAAAEGLLHITTLLLEAGASVLLKDRWGNTPFDDACMAGNRKIIKLLEDARFSQLSMFSSSSFQIQDKMDKKECSSKREAE